MAREHVWGHAGSSGDHETALALCFPFLSFPFLSSFKDAEAVGEEGGRL